MSILVSVVNQKMYLSSAMEGLVAGSQNFVKFRFNLGEDWDGLMTFAQFRQSGVAYNQYLDEENSVFLPKEIGPGTCTLMLYGTHDTTIGTTNYLTLKIDKNILVSDATSTEISQSLYDQLVTKVNTLSSQNEQMIKKAVAEEMEQYLLSGELGQDGVTPHIGDNGNWFIGDTDTEVKAAGEDGVTPHIGDNGNWFIGDTDTEVKAAGEDIPTELPNPYSLQINGVSYDGSVARVIDTRNVIVTVTGDSENGYTSDKSSTEIYVLFNMGNTILCYLSHMDIYVPLVSCSAECCSFTINVGSILTLAAHILENKGVSIEENYPSITIADQVWLGESVDFTETINSMIETKLSSFTNAEEVAF